MEKLDKHLIVRNGDLNCILHINPELEVICVKKGSLTVRFDDSEVTVNENQAALVLPYRLHGVKMPVDSQAFVLMFSPNISGDFYDHYKAMDMKKYIFDLPETLRNYMETVLAEIADNMTLFNVKSLYYPLVNAYLKDNEAVVSKNNAANTLIRKVAEFVAENFKEDITVEDAAKAVGEGRSKVSALLKEYAGVSFVDFLNIVRAQKARGIVEFTDRPITEIAYYCGFGSVRNFNRVFQEVFGCSPSGLRKSEK